MLRLLIAFLAVMLALLDRGVVTSTAGAVADWRVEGEQIGADFAHSVAMAGDVNGDGFGDVVVGSPRHSNGIYREGTAFLYDGSPNGLNASPAWRAGGDQTGSRFGSAVAGAGDVNGDGYDDVIVGAPEFNGEVGTKSGALFVFYGGPDGLSLAPDWSLDGPHGSAALGNAVAGAGDINGDGYDDVIAGAKWYGNGEEREGAAFAYCGSAAGLGNVPCWQVEGNQKNAALGSAVAPAGDVDQDGYADVAVGAPYGTCNNVVTGFASVYHGSASGLSPLPRWTAYGSGSDAGFGAAVNTAGDVDGTGYPDLIVGSPGHSHSFESEGAAYLFRADSDGLQSTAAWQATGGQPWALLGSAVSAAGDLNADGYDDVIVGAPFYSEDQPAEGATFLFYGWDGGLESTAAWRAFGDKAEAHFGFGLGGGADVGDDGRPDLIVGAPDYRRGEIIVGCAFGYYGPFPPAGPRHHLYLPLLNAAG